MYAAAALSAAALLLVVAFYRAPEGAAPAPMSWRVSLSRSEWLLASVAGLIWCFFNLGFTVLLAFGPSHLVARGYSVASAGAVASLVMWVSAPALPFAGYLCQRIGRPDAMMGGCFVALTLATLALALGAQPVIMCVLIGILITPPPGLILQLLTEVLRPKNRAAGIGVFYTFLYAALAFLNPVAGALRDATAEPAAPVILCAALFAAGLLSLFLFRAMQRRATVAVSAAA
jgi:MFS family permease